MTVPYIKRKAISVAFLRFKGVVLLQNLRQSIYQFYSRKKLNFSYPKTKQNPRFVKTEINQFDK